jgi:hypothetical protein
MFLEFAGIFTGIATVNKEMHIDIPHHLRDAFRKKNPEKWKPTVGSSFMTILQHTGQFCSRIS